MKPLPEPQHIAEVFPRGRRRPLEFPSLSAPHLLLLISLTFLSGQAYSQQQNDRPFSSKYYGYDLCRTNGFKCHRVRPGQTWRSLFQDSETRRTVKKFNRINIALANRPFIVIPSDLSSGSYQSLSPMPEYVNSRGEKMILVNLEKQAFSAYDERGNMVRWGPISGGKSYCRDLKRSCLTIEGSYRIYLKRGKECASRKYKSPMPYCMFYKDGYAIHGADLPGHHASHGCVRVFVDDARWLSREFAKVGTRVKIIRGD